MQKQLIRVLAAMFFLTSCQSLKNLSSKDNSASTTSSAKNNGKDIRFLDDISVTPGDKSSDKKYIYNSARESKRATTNWEDAKPDVSSLQTKYAILIDVPAQQLSNAALLQQIDDWWGTKYCRGGVNYECIDCSAFTQMMLRDVYSVRIPRTAHEQYDFSPHVKQRELKEGDLVFFHTTTRGVSHVGLYLRNDKFVHASSSGVMISDLNDDYWNARFVAGGRVITGDDAAAISNEGNMSAK